MQAIEVRWALEHLTVLVDTREQSTERLKERLDSFGLPYKRQKLPFGDYSARCTLPSGDTLDFSEKFAIERKMNLDELCQCFTHGRQRFIREFERAKAQGAKLYLLIENGSFESMYNHKYRSKTAPNAVVASTLAWLARYDCQVIFCKPETTGKLIADIVYRQVKEFLEKGGAVDE